MADNHFKINKGVSLAPQTGAPANPANGDLYYDTSLNKFRKYENGAWSDLGSGGAAGLNLNFVTNPSAEVDTADWATFDDGAVSLPVDMTGGSPSQITFSRTTTSGEFLNGVASFKIVKSAANAQGEGVSTLMTIPEGYRGRQLLITAPFKIISGSLLEGDLKAFLYDVTNSSVITPLNNVIVGSQGMLYALASSNLNTASMRFGLMFASTSTSAVTLSFDDVTVSPSQTALGSSPGISATGGTVTQDGPYTVHTFTSSGSFVIASGSGTVESLVVAGGGGGGTGEGGSGGGGGGGGAGGLVYTSPGGNYSTGSHTVTIGAGGSPNGNGSNSVFASITATGGGGAPTYPSAGNNGGSGGGGSSSNSGGTGVGGQGFSGGTGGGATNAAGGGGGSGSVGAAGVSGTGGSGGTGTAISISGSSVFYASGGGGGSYSTGGTVSAGGGGAGGGSATPGTAATANTGGGGGGGGNSSSAGGTGGSGIVILRYLTNGSTITTASSTFKMSSILASGTRVTSTPTQLGEYRTYKKASSAFTGADEAPTASPSATDGMRIFAVPYASAGGTGQTNRWEVFVGKNKSVKPEFYAASGKTGWISCDVMDFTDSKFVGVFQSYDPTSGVMVLDAISSTSSATDRLVGVTIPTAGSAYTQPTDCYFDIIVSENALAVGVQSPRSEVWLTEQNGYGSTNTKIARFATVKSNVGTAITYADSATLGASFTINETGVYAMNYSATFSGVPARIGLSLNTTAPTTTIQSISSSERLSYHYVSGADGGESTQVSMTKLLQAGDVIRPHNSGDTFYGGAQDWVTFIITKVSN